MAFSVLGRRVVVVGGERSGAAAAELLAARGAVVTVTDLKPELKEADRLRAAGVRLELGRHRPETFRDAALVVLSPGVSPTQPQVAAARGAGVPVIGEIELAYRFLRGRLIAITGTKGKSTTAALVGRMLQAGGRNAPVGGNIGDALSAQVAASTPDTLHVVEVSSFQLEMTDTFRPWIAVVLNLSPDHLDRHATLGEYEAAKRRIFANQEASDWAVVNADDAGAAALAAGGRAVQRRFALETPLDDGVVVRREQIVRVTDASAHPLVPLSAVRLTGRHLLSDVLAAAAVADLVGVPPEAMTRAVEGFAGLEHAMEFVAEVKGVRFVNDSKATNVDAALHGILSVPEGLVAIVGGRYKGGDFRLLRAPLRARARAVFALGEARALVREALAGAVPVHEAATLGEAVREAYALARPGGTVLLAPACSSFDMFENYAARGRAFKREVEALAIVEDTRER